MIVKLISKDIIKSACSPTCQIKTNPIIGLSSWLPPSRCLTYPQCTAVLACTTRLWCLLHPIHLHSLNTFPFPWRPCYLSFPTLSTALSCLAHSLSDSSPITHKPCSDKCYLSIIRLVQFIICQMKYNWYALITTLKCLTDARGLMVMIDMANSVQILDEAVCIFHRADTLRNDMYPTILSSGIVN